MYVTLRATRSASDGPDTPRRRTISYSRRAGKNADGPEIRSEVAEFLKATYLKPLRDAESELSAGRGSRLAHILASHPKFAEQKTSDFDKLHPDLPVKTIVGIMEQAEYNIANNEVVKGREKEINESYLAKLKIGSEPLEADIILAKLTELRQVLEKLELVFDVDEKAGKRCPRGLGYNNVLFMATELLLLGGEESETNALLLIEEPEAHLHPQLQLRLMSFLEEQSDKNSVPHIQIIVTTHSPNLASKVAPEQIILMKDGMAYSLAPKHTKLSPGDYCFLRRFLDVTKANLFFAKGVIIVEGDAENLLLPTLARKIDRALDKHGVSIVNVGHTGLLRYARIFQRQEGPNLPIPVACVKDLDCIPDEIEYDDKKLERRQLKQTEDSKKQKIERLCGDDGGDVETFLTEDWTFEYEMARSGIAKWVHVAIVLAAKSKSSDGMLSDLVRSELTRNANKEYDEWMSTETNEVVRAGRVYEPLYKSKASKAVTAQFLAELLEGEDHDPNEFRALLPTYLVHAIDWATGHKPTEAKSDAP